MRLRRLDLIRYGKFTDERIDFGPASKKAPDLHIIYGPNEAGKSTILSAWLDLLFGIPAQSRYNFIHSYQAMRIGAVIEVAGKTLDLARIKGNTNTLLDAADAPQPETLLQAGLSGIDRSRYQSMFSLDDETLEAGGKDILASQGDLGQLLFSASAGLAELSATMEALRTEADSFHRLGGRKGRLADLKAEIAGLDDERQKLDTAARDYTRIVDARDIANQSWRNAQKLQADIAARLQEVDRQLAALPNAVRMRQLAQTLADMEELPSPPEGWAAELIELERDNARVNAGLRSTTESIAGLQDEMTAAVPDPAALAAQSDIEAAEMLKSAHDEAVKDLPNRLRELDTIEKTIAELLDRLGQSDRKPDQVLLGTQAVATLRRLLEERSGIDSAMSLATEELETAIREHREAERKLSEAGGDGGDVAALAALLGQLRARDPGGTLDRAETALSDAQDLWTDRLTKLHPWEGDSDSLGRMPVPDAATVEDWKARLQAGSKRAESAERMVAELDDNIATKTTRLGTQRVPDSVTLKDAADIRTRREALWADHVATLTPETAGTFESAMRLDDQVTARQAAAQAAAVQVADLRTDIAELGIRRAREATALQAANAALDAVNWQIANAVTAMAPTLAGLTTPDAIEAWLRRRENALEAHGAVIKAQRARDLALKTLRDACAVLDAELRIAGRESPPDTSYATLLARAQAHVDAAAKFTALREAKLDRALNQTRREDDLRKAQMRDETWHNAWRGVCNETWMAKHPPGPEEMRAVLTALDELDRVVTAHRGLAERIAKMRQNLDAFTLAVKTLGDRLEIPAPGREARHIWVDILSRLQTAKEAEKKRRELAGKLENAARANTDLATESDRIARRIGEMGAYFDVEGLSNIRTRLDAAITRVNVKCDHDERVADLCQTLGQDRIEDALGSLEGVDQNSLSAQRATLEQELGSRNTEVQTLFADLSEAKRQIDAVGGDDVVAHLNEKRRNALLEIDESARTHLRRRLGIIAVKHALRRYRDTHRSGMMQRAESAFRTISRGAYTELATQPEKSGDLLVALAADGSSKSAPDLSKGTRFQLYLALRVAGYHEYAAAQTSVPFIADDILETFDDDRSAETFSLLAEMGQVGQVIYLTHHRHLCEIAKMVCPKITLHEIC